MTDAPQLAHDYHPWTTYIAAREEARRRGDRRVGTDHLLLGLLREPELAQALDRDLRTAREALDAMDAEALAVVGLGAEVSVPPVPSRADMRPPRPTIRAVLHDRLPLTPAAKTALQKSGRDLRRRRRIEPWQVFAALLELEFPDPAAQLLAALEIDRTAVRAKLLDRPG